MKLSVKSLSWVQRLSLGILLISLVPAAHSFTLDDLRRDPELTPARLLQRFAHFKFELAERVQPADTFLARQTGDCDDFATLAADLLEEKGYTPRLMVVFMPKEIHVVCYVEEVKAYLDFNNRALPDPLTPSDGTLADIGAKVAESFTSTWHCASEFTYRNGVRRFLFTDFRQATPASDTPTPERGQLVKASTPTPTP